MYFYLLNNICIGITLQLENKCDFDGSTMYQTNKLSIGNIFYILHLNYDEYIMLVISLV